MDSSNYNDEPVFYCKNCLSLKVKMVATGLDLDFCDECGSTDIEQAHIEEWRKLYRGRYGFDYLTKELNNNGREERKAEL
jgi:hypothetical protein